MRQGSPSGRRPRGRHNGSNGGGAPTPSGPMRGGDPNAGRPRSASSLRHQTFDSNGPEVRVRGNAWQVYEKYQSLARDAQGSGDRVLAENYLQYAEHYFRVIEAINDATAVEQQQQQQPRGPAPTPFSSSQQPDVPSNYYAPNGQLMGSPQPSMPAPQQDGNMAQPQEPEQAQVTSTRRVSPPPAEDPSNPFLMSDELDEPDLGPQKLVAGR